jgi:hypothetical protein
LAILNQLSLSALSLPVTILYTCSMCACFLHPMWLAPILSTSPRKYSFSSQTPCPQNASALFPVHLYTELSMGTMLVFQFQMRPHIVLMPLLGRPLSVPARASYQACRNWRSLPPVATLSHQFIPGKLKSPTIILSFSAFCQYIRRIRRTVRGFVLDTKIDSSSTIRWYVPVRYVPLCLIPVWHVPVCYIPVFLCPRMFHPYSGVGEVRVNA